MVEEGHGRYSVFKLGRGRLVEHDAGIQEARTHLQRIVRNMRPFSVDPEMRAQYERYAPTPFYPKFKLDFMPVLEAHGDEAARGRVDSDQAALLTEALRDATMSFPAVPLFRDFKRPYSDFEKACRRALKWAGKGDKKGYAQLVKKAADMSRQVWDAFACGARIMEHDDAYSGRVDDWRAQFSEKTRALSSATDDFYLDVLDVVGSENGYERAISGDDLIDRILEYRKSGEIAYIKFSSPGEQIWLASEQIRQLPEYRIFVDEGQLDWLLMKSLDDAELKHVVSRSMTGRPVYVSYVENPPRTITYRMIKTPRPAGNLRSR